MQEAAARVVAEVLGSMTKVLLVHETLAVAMQFVSLPPYDPRTFMIVDMGASHLTVSLFEFARRAGGDEGADGADVGMVLREIESRTNVFVGGDEMVHSLMLWCERRKPFQVGFWAESFGRRAREREMVGRGGGREEESEEEEYECARARVGVRGAEMSGRLSPWVWIFHGWLWW